MSRRQTAEELVDELLDQEATARRTVAIAGPPGSGKSTLTELLKEKINAVRPGFADILMMDGYHLASVGSSQNRRDLRCGPTAASGGPDPASVKGCGDSPEADHAAAPDL